MTIDHEGEFVLPSSVAPESAKAMAEAIEFYSSEYDVQMFQGAPGGHKTYLGVENSACRFCSRGRPEVTFKKAAHAISELLGNRTLLSRYECDDCNARFSVFESDLAAMSYAARMAGQVLGKKGVPSTKTREGKSRIDFKRDDGYLIQNYEDDPIAEIDEANHTLTIGGQPRGYRPLGVFKSLTKTAVTLLRDDELPHFKDALTWLREKDVSTNLTPGSLNFVCMSTFTPGESPFGNTKVILLRRRSSDGSGPALISLVMFGCTSYQTVVPSPSLDAHHIGGSVKMPPIPIFPFLDDARVRGLTQFGLRSLASPSSEQTEGVVTFHVGSIERVPPS